MHRSTTSQKQTRSKPADGEHTSLCLPCHRKGERKQASGYCKTCKEHLCAVCYKSHKRTRGNAAHVLVEGRSMPKQTKSSLDQTSKCGSVPCSKHAGNDIEIVCHAHKITICKQCLEADHKECTTDFIRDFANQYIKGTDFLSSKATVDAVFDFCTQAEATLKRANQTFGETCSQAIVNIDKFRADIDSMLDKWQEDAKKTIKDTKATHAEEMARASDMVTASKAEMSNIKTRINELQSSDQHKRLVAELFQSVANIDAHVATLQAKAETKFIARINFVPNANLQRAFEQESALGKIESTSDPAPYYTEIRQPPQLVKKLNVKASEDKKKCWVRSMKEVALGKIIAVDHTNSAVKLIDIEKNEVTQRLQFFFCPYDVAIIPEASQAAVTCPSGVRIEFVSTGDELKVERTMQLKERLQCHGIAYASGKLVVGYYCNFGRCDIMTLEGQVLHKCLDISLGEYINYAAIGKDEEYVLVSDTKNNRVLKMSWTGVLLREYRDPCFEEIEAIAVRRDGSFYVCSYNAGSVHRVSGDHMTKTDTVLTENDGIGKPVGLCWSTQGELLVSCFGNDAYVFK